MKEAQRRQGEEWTYHKVLNEVTKLSIGSAIEMTVKGETPWSFAVVSGTVLQT